MCAEDRRVEERDFGRGSQYTVLSTSWKHEDVSKLERPFLVEQYEERDCGIRVEVLDVSVGER